MMSKQLKIPARIRTRIANYIADGNDIVEVTVSGSKCPQCSMYENRLFSLTGETSGLPLLSSAIEGGLFHKGCTHTICAVPKTVAFSDHTTNGYPFTGINSLPAQKQRNRKNQIKKNIVPTQKDMPFTRNKQITSFEIIAYSIGMILVLWFLFAVVFK